MRIEIHCEENELGTPIEIANGLIKNRLDRRRDNESIEAGMRELAEIVEHIEVYLQYNGYPVYR